MVMEGMAVPALGTISGSEFWGVLRAALAPRHGSEPPCQPGTRMRDHTAGGLRDGWLLVQRARSRPGKSAVPLRPAFGFVLKDMHRRPSPPGPAPAPAPASAVGGTSRASHAAVPSSGRDPAGALGTAGHGRCGSEGTETRSSRTCFPWICSPGPATPRSSGLAWDSKVPTPPGAASMGKQPPTRTDPTAGAGPAASGGAMAPGAWQGAGSTVGACRSGCQVGMLPACPVYPIEGTSSDVPAQGHGDRGSRISWMWGSAHRWLGGFTG